MASFVDDLVHLVPELDRLDSILFVKLIFLLRHILGLNFFVFKAVELEDLAVIFWFKNTVRKLSMEEPGSFR